MPGLSEFVRVERQSNVHLVVGEAQTALFLPTFWALLEVFEEGGETLERFPAINEVI